MVMALKCQAETKHTRFCHRLKEISCGTINTRTTGCCFFPQAYDAVVIRDVKLKHALARKYLSQIPAVAEWLHGGEIQPAALGNLLVSKPITKATEQNC